ncbi:hypothetical protein D3C80_2168630 [compost metagenome]
MYILVDTALDSAAGLAVCVCDAGAGVAPVPAELTGLFAPEQALSMMTRHSNIAAPIEILVFLYMDESPFLLY